MSDDLDGVVLVVSGTRACQGDRWLLRRDEAVHIGDVDPVVAAGADEARVDLGDHRAGLLRELTMVPEPPAEAAVAIPVGWRHRAHEDVRRPAVGAAVLELAREQRVL